MNNKIYVKLRICMLQIYVSAGKLIKKRQKMRQEGKTDTELISV